MLFTVKPIINTVEQLNSNSIQIKWDVKNGDMFNLTKFRLKFLPDFVHYGWPGNLKSSEVTASFYFNLNNSAIQANKQ